MPQKQPDFKEILESYLDAIPIATVEFTTNQEELIVITVPRYKKQWQQKWAKRFGWPLTRKIDLDELGSFVWKSFDGKTTVREIANKLQQELNAEDALMRTALFVRYLYLQGWIELLKP